MAFVVAAIILVIGVALAFLSEWARGMMDAPSLEESNFWPAIIMTIVISALVAGSHFISFPHW